MNPFSEQQLDALTELCRRHHVTRLDLFGSATGSGFDPASSDLDFLVEFEDLEAPEYSDAYFGLLEGLESAFGGSVDLVVESAVTNPFFRESFEKTRVQLYAA